MATLLPKTILIGDVHGCRNELEDLLAACGFVRGDNVILVGDLVAKGPDSRGVVDLVRGIGARAVLGNHDAHVLAVAPLSTAEAHQRGRAHHHQVAQALGSEHLNWLATLPLWLRVAAGTDGPDVLVVHGGLVPGRPLQEQQAADMLNLRSIRADGSPSKRIEGSPWAALWPGPEHVVFGHDAVRGLQRHPHATGIDTGCVYGHRLTALLLPEHRLVSVPARQIYARVD